MNSQHKLHDVILKPAFFENKRQATLLRYLDADFIARFQQDIQQQRFSGIQFSEWQEEERHSDFDDRPVLRLPTHRAFHIVCCEVACNRLGEPALDPAKIASAGFVIRRESLVRIPLRNKEGDGFTQDIQEKKGVFNRLTLNQKSDGRSRGKPQFTQVKKQFGWILEDGEAIGWQHRGLLKDDPDLSRRLCRNGVLHRNKDQNTYSGEEIHPLHPLKIKDKQGKCRTLLFGYVPLGGFYYERQPELSDDEAEEIDQLSTANLPWPFGYKSGVPTEGWNSDDGLQVNRGRPTVALATMLSQLVNRYHLGEENLPDNSGLQQACDRLDFYNPDLIFQMPVLPVSFFSSFSGVNEIFQQTLNAGTLSLQFVSAGLSLGQYLKDCFAQKENNPLVRWIADVEVLADSVGGIENLPQLPPLPNADGNGVLSYSLSVSESDAELLRQQLGARLRNLTLATTREIPLPKFGQGRQDTYRIIPFLRSLTDQGGEQITWADPLAQSDLFRVAASFDPMASRPSLIPMPSLKDLKRGMAKGASILTPGDTFALVNALKLKKGVSEDAVNIDTSVASTVQWICSFSLPVVTLVAMILLMIMVSLLNIIFFWMPWVKICLPFPSIPKGR